MPLFRLFRADPPRFFRRVPFLAVGLWALAIAAGFRGLVEYELRSGAPATAPERWPIEAGVPFDSGRVNLVMFAHPQCPCSRASMAELTEIMTRCAADLRATVCFFDPDGEPATWTQTALWRTAAAIPGVAVIADREHQIALQFGAATSGQVFLFDRNGRRLFAGGITGARGHQGENRGRNYVIALARGEVCEGSSTPVFGCSLDDPTPRLSAIQP